MVLMKKNLITTWNLHQQLTRCGMLFFWHNQLKAFRFQLDIKLIPMTNEIIESILHSSNEYLADAIRRQLDMDTIEIRSSFLIFLPTTLN